MSRPHFSDYLAPAAPSSAHNPPAPGSAPPLKHLSVCSGVGAPDLAWAGIGLSEPLAFAEIEAFPAAVLAARFPGVPNLGDLTRWRDWPAALLAAADILVGGTPCQDFSVAGARAGLDGDRGRLTLDFLELADAIDDLRRAAGRPACWVCWENVDGVLSDKGNGFGHVLGRISGGDAALDRRWSRRAAGLVMGSRRSAAWRLLDAQHFGVAQRRKRIFLLARGYPGTPDWGPADALLPVIESGDWRAAGGGSSRAYVAQADLIVRRLTPVECERLQGFPDGWTDIPWRRRPHAPDGPRYKAMGNSWAVPCGAYVGRRIMAVDGRFAP